MAEKLTGNLFLDDLFDQTYKFWETDEDKQERLRKIWLDLKRKNALGGVEARTTQEQDELNVQIVELARKVRFRIDQELVKRNVDPLFKENYRAYDKEEFLVDANVEFVKVKRLLERNPKMLKEDPLLGLDYVKILNLIKRKKLLENSSNHFDPQDSIDSTYLTQIDEREVKLQKHIEDLERFNREQLFGDGTAGSRADNEIMDEDEEKSVRTQKKKEEREKEKLLKQFDALASQFEKSNKII